MSILDIFNFKKKIQEVATKENVESIIGIARDKILEQAKDKATKGIQKMDNVVDEVIEFIEEKIYSDNKIVQWVIDNILIPNIRTITQAIYDLLKQTVKGL